MKSKLLLLLIGTIVWSLTMVKSGLSYSYGLGFWGANGHDGIWHLALINSLKTGSFQLPTFAGETLHNYHFGFDLLVATASLLTSLPSLTLYFQLLPPLFAFLIGLLTYHLIRQLGHPRAAAWWSVFFIYFGTGLGWLLGKGESVFWSQQAISTLINPPFALSLIFILGIVWLFNRKSYLPAILLLIFLPHIKIYAGLLVFAGLSVAALFNSRLRIPLLIAGLIAVPLFLLVNPSGSHLIVWSPGWFLTSLFAPDRLDHPHFFSALNTYRSGLIWPKLIPAYALAAAVFLIGNLGARLVFLTQLKRRPSWDQVFFITIFLLGCLLPNLIIQKGTAWNSIQFFYYSLFAAALLSGPAMANLLSRLSQTLKLGLIAVVLFFTLPGNLDTLRHYIPSRPPAMLSTAELAALKFLSQQPPGVVLTQPFDPDAAAAAVNSPPRPLQLYESTAYVTAFSSHPSFLEDQVNADILGLDWKYRRDQALNFFTTTSTEEQQTFLIKNNIKYLYLTDKLPKPQSLPPSETIYSSLGLTLISFKY